MKKSIPVIALFIMAFTNSNFAQQNHQEVYQSRVIAKYYQQHELAAAEVNAPEKFKYIKYFYLNSFTITDGSCDGCKPYTKELIDINDYNYLRNSMRSISYTDPVYGFTITLCSQRELDLMVLYDKVEFNNDQTTR